MRAAIALLVAVLASGTAPSRAAEPAPAAPLPRTGTWISDGIADASRPEATRRALAADLLAKADAGDRGACWTAGSLLRHGPDRKGNLLPRDLERAQGYLFCAASQGQPFAMAQLAEVDAELGLDVEAMVWAQLYVRVNEAMSGAAWDGYEHELIARLMRKLDDGERKAAEERLAEVQRRYGARILAAMQQQRDENASADLGYATDQQRSVPPTHRGERSALTLFLVEIDRSGRIARSWLLDALPGLVAVPVAERVLASISFTATDAPEPRFAVLPIARDLRPDR